MKKIHTLTFIVSFLITGVSHAQIKKGATFLGGDISANAGNRKTDGVKTDNWHYVFISPVFGKAIRENLVFGVDAYFSFGYNAGPSSPPGKSRGYGLGTFLRKYGQLGKSGFSLFLHNRFGGNYQSNRLDPINRKETSFSIGFSAYPGLSYRVSRKLQLETGFNNLLSLNYTRGKSHTGGTVPSTQISNSFGFSTSLNNLSSLYAGFRVLIN